LLFFLSSVIHISPRVSLSDDKTVFKHLSLLKYCGSRASSDFFSKAFAFSYLFCLLFDDFHDVFLCSG